MPTRKSALSDSGACVYTVPREFYNRQLDLPCSRFEFKIRSFTRAKAVTHQQGIYVRLQDACRTSNLAETQQEMFVEFLVRLPIRNFRRDVLRSRDARSCSLPISRWFDWWLWSLPCQACEWE